MPHSGQVRIQGVVMSCARSWPQRRQLRMGLGVDTVLVSCDHADVVSAVGADTGDGVVWGTEASECASDREVDRGKDPGDDRDGQHEQDERQADDERDQRQERSDEWVGARLQSDNAGIHTELYGNRGGRV